MQLQSFPFPECFVHVEWLTESIGIARLFEEPLGQIDAETGQPWKSFSWTCVVVLEQAVLTICAAMTAPHGKYLRALLHAASQLGAKQVSWERWVEGKKRPKIFSLKGDLLDDDDEQAREAALRADHNDE